MGYFSMPKYFQDMPVVGKPLVNANAENEAELKEIEKNIHDKVEEILAKGITCLLYTSPSPRDRG